MSEQHTPEFPEQHAHAGIEDLDLSARQEHLLTCPACHHLIKADDININKLVAKCANCAQVFSFENSHARELTGYSRPEMLIPQGLEVLKLTDEMDVQVNWFRTIERSSLTFTLTFALIWNLILLPFVLMAIFTGAYALLLFTSLHLLVGIGMLLRLLAIFVNTTHVNVSRRFLEIQTSPLPSLFRKNRKIPAEEITQLYVTKYVESRTNGRPNIAYALHAILKNGKKLKLVNGMNESTQKYLEYEIESFLGITDRPVKDGV